MKARDEMYKPKLLIDVTEEQRKERQHDKDKDVDKDKRSRNGGGDRDRENDEHDFKREEEELNHNDELPSSKRRKSAVSGMIFLHELHAQVVKRSNKVKFVLQITMMMTMTISTIEVNCRRHMTRNTNTRKWIRLHQIKVRHLNLLGTIHLEIM